MKAKDALEALLKGQQEILSRLDDQDQRLTRLEAEDELDFEVEVDGFSPEVTASSSAPADRGVAGPSNLEELRKIGARYDEPEPEFDDTPEGAKAQAAWRVEHEIHVETGDEAKARARANAVPQMETVGDEVRFAKPNAKQLALRKQILPDIGFEHWTRPMNDESPAPPPADQREPAFLAGGPLWLYFYCRDFVMSLGLPVRQAFVQDVLLGPDPDTAEWLGRDILKREQHEGEGSGVALESIMALKENVSAPA